MRTDDRSRCRAGPQPRTPQQHRSRDGRQPIQEPRRDTGRRHRTDRSTLDAPVATQSHRADLGRQRPLRWAPQISGPAAVAVQAQSVAIVCCTLTPRAVARPRGLHVGLILRPRVDVELGLDQFRCCSRHLFGAGAPGRRVAAKLSSSFFFWLVARIGSLVKPGSEDRGSYARSRAPPIFTLDDPAAASARRFGIILRGHVHAPRHHWTRLLTTGKEVRRIRQQPRRWYRARP